jgi:hypothetical protein
MWLGRRQHGQAGPENHLHDVHGRGECRSHVNDRSGGGRTRGRDQHDRSAEAGGAARHAGRRSEHRHDHGDGRTGQYGDDDGDGELVQRTDGVGDHDDDDDGSPRGARVP